LWCPLPLREDRGGVLCWGGAGWTWAVRATWAAGKDRKLDARKARRVHAPPPAACGGAGHSFFLLPPSDAGARPCQRIARLRCGVRKATRAPATAPMHPQPRTHRPTRPQPIVLHDGGDARVELRAGRAVLRQARAQARRAWALLAQPPARWLRSVAEERRSLCCFVCQAAGSLRAAVAPLLHAYGAELRAQCALVEKCFHAIAGKPTRAIGSQARRTAVAALCGAAWAAVWRVGGGCVEGRGE
jgi:hypothetical protein